MYIRVEDVTLANNSIQANNSKFSSLQLQTIRPDHLYPSI